MSSKSRRIAKVCEYIDANLEKELNLSEVAALVNMSDSAFSHFFKKRTGLSYINYVNNQRIAKACDLLAGTTQSAAEICYDVYIMASPPGDAGVAHIKKDAFDKGARDVRYTGA